MIYWKFKYSRTQRALAVGVSENNMGSSLETAVEEMKEYLSENEKAKAVVLEKKV